MTTQAPAQREPGWYWVRHRNLKVVGEWLGTYWRLTAYSNVFKDDDFYEIGPRILPPTAPQAEEAAAKRLASDNLERAAQAYGFITMPDPISLFKDQFDMIKRIEAAIAEAERRGAERMRAAANVC